MISPEVPKPDDQLIPPCVAAFKYDFNRGNAITPGTKLDAAGALEPYVLCKGVSDPWCRGGQLEWPPDPIRQQDEFCIAMAAICTARIWRRRENNGVTTPVERIGE